jgi:acetyl esterase
VTHGWLEVAGIETRAWWPTAGETTRGEWVLYVHGGGFTAGSPDVFDAHGGWLAQKTGVPVFAPRYRLAPRHPHPAAGDDCGSVHEHLTGTRGRSPRAIVGVSAGGSIAVSLASRLGAGSARLLALESPLLDERVVTSSSQRSTDPGWTAEHARRAWAAYLPSPVPSGVAPRCVTSGLPPVFLSVGGGEVSLDETLTWAADLARASVPCELHVWAGQFHGFETKRPDLDVSRASRRLQLEAVLRA